MKKLYPLFLLIVALSLVVTGCGRAAKVKEEAAEKLAEVKATVEEVATEAVEPTAPPTSTPEEEKEATPLPTETSVAAPTTPPTSPPEQPTPAGEEPTAKPAVEPSGAGAKIASPEEALDSYRRRTTTRIQGEDGSWGPAITVEIEWVREPEAQRMVVYDESGAVSVEVITVGSESWAKMGDIWVKSEVKEAPAGTGDGLQMLLEAQEAMEGGMTPVGEETVNDVHCQRYTLDATVTIPFPVPEDVSEEAAEMTATEIVVHESGDLWVADQAGLPPVTIRSLTEGEMISRLPSGDEKTILQQESDLYDINQPITIEPPSEEEIGAAASKYPMVPDAEVTMATDRMTVYTTGSSVEEVVTFYEVEMPNAGWTQQGQTTKMMDMALMSFTKEGESVMVNIQAQEGGGTQVTFMSTL